MQRLTSPSKALAVRGQLTIHSAPSALRQHIDWAIQELLGATIACHWSPQTLRAGTFKTIITWRDRPGVAGQLASSLRSWHYITFEVQEDSHNGGELFRFTPELGIHRAVTDLSGAVVITEDQLDVVLRNNHDEDSIRTGIAQIIGSDWESELECFRGVNHQEISSLRAI
ncbi:unannotated protein [freshwater metagenome]|uniref:Unannotated protein n=1 Tax=freshwater metagenome TaxID=449393 RepID=A0A6J7A6A0_9ZZZZ|nr:DUF3145 family protein [Actinomycetota bacterium]